jgi:hypothetical protein
MPAAPQSRKPWPMKWVVVVIVAVIVPYTFLTLRYRKPNKAFEPYHDMQDRANTLRLLSAGFQRVSLGAARPADPIHGATVTTTSAPGGVPEALRATLVIAPLLPAEILSVSAAPSMAANEPYPVPFTCVVPDNKEQLGGAELYVRGQEIWITPNFERLTGGLIARSRENMILLTVPAATLKPGRYHVTLVGQTASRAWTLQVH